MGGGMKKTNFVASACPHMGICKVWAVSTPYKVKSWIRNPTLDPPGFLNPAFYTQLDTVFFHLEKIPSGTIFDGFCRYFNGFKGPYVPKVVQSEVLW